MATKLSNKTLQAINLTMSNINANNTSQGQITLGSNFSATGINIDSFLMDNFFPTLFATYNVTRKLNDRWTNATKSISENRGAYTQEYVFADAMNVGLKFTDRGRIQFERNVPQTLTKIYGAGYYMHRVWTFDNTQIRQNMSTFAELLTYYGTAVEKILSDTAMQNEYVKTASILQYQPYAKDVTNTVTDDDSFVKAIYEKTLAMLEKSAAHNEASAAQKMVTNPALALRYTSMSDLEDIYILTSTKTKALLLNSYIANTFNAAGIDLLSHVISYDSFDIAVQLTDDVTLTADDVAAIKVLYQDIQPQIGDVVYKDSIFTFDTASMLQVPSFAGKLQTLSPFVADGGTLAKDYFAAILDVNALNFLVDFQNMFGEPQKIGGGIATQHFLNYYQNNYISVFENKAYITDGASI
jgi:hypothetical protein